MRQRKKEIRRILKTAWYKTEKDRKIAAESFFNSNLDLAQIEDLVRILKPEYYQDLKPKVKSNDTMGGIG